MSWPEAPHDLLVGPHGRRLCWELADVSGPRGRGHGLSGWREVMFGAGHASHDQLAAELREVVASLDLAAVGALTAESALLAPLTDTVARATYWQHPDEVDTALADAAVSAALAPVAAAVTAAPAATWWATPLERNRQVYARFLRAGDHVDTGLPVLHGAAARLATWRRQAAADELHAVVDRPAELSSNTTGHWWSTPNTAGLVVTSRSLSGLGAVRLALAEDTVGWSGALCWRVVPQSAARVYEIQDPRDWMSLVDRYPLDVTNSRRHDWWRATGWSGRWLIPDFAAIAVEYDGVHLTVGGYLTAAGRALPVRAGRTMVAGWDPDATYWLTDALAGVGGPVRWRVAPDLAPFRWAAISADA